VKTTGGFTTAQLNLEERSLTLPFIDTHTALQIGELSKLLGEIKNLPIAVEVRIGNWVVYHASLPGSTSKNQHWIDRKARVVLLKRKSTLYEKVSAEERGVDWYIENNLSEETHAIDGGGIPLITKSDGFVGSLLISGLPQLEDHLFGAKVLSEFLSSNSELL